MIRLPLAPLVAATAFSCLMVPSSRALVIFGGTGTEQTSDPLDGLPWGNAGKVGVGGGVFLGSYGTGNWVLTASHLVDGGVMAANGAPGITLGGTFYAGVAGSGVRVLNGDSSPTDLYLFRIAASPGLPSVALASARPALGAVVTAIGFGAVETAFKRWDVTNDVWTETSDVAASDYVGYTVGAGGTERWGDALYRGNANSYNIGTGLTAAITTSFDPLTGSSLGVSGDSGGPLFYNDGGQWVLGGIFGALASVSAPSTPPPGGAVATGKTFNTNLYNLNLSADVVAYRAFIVSATGIPEPAAWTALAGGAALLAAGGRRRRRA